MNKINDMEELKQYRAIGTVESLKNLPAICDSLAESSMKAEKLIEELQAYRAIGTIEEFKALKEKNVAKKQPKMIGYRKDGEPVYECGCCGNTLKVADQPYCMICGCKLDWQ